MSLSPATVWLGVPDPDFCSANCYLGFCLRVYSNFCRDMMGRQCRTAQLCVPSMWAHVINNVSWYDCSKTHFLQKVGFCTHSTHETFAILFSYWQWCHPKSCWKCLLDYSKELNLGIEVGCFHHYHTENFQLFDAFLTLVMILEAKLLTKHWLSLQLTDPHF